MMAFLALPPLGLFLTPAELSSHLKSFEEHEIFSRALALYFSLVWHACAGKWNTLHITSLDYIADYSLPTPVRH